MRKREGWKRTSSHPGELWVSVSHRWSTQCQQRTISASNGNVNAVCPVWFVSVVFVLRCVWFFLYTILRYKELFVWPAPTQSCSVIGWEFWANMRLVRLLLQEGVSQCWIKTRMWCTNTHTHTCSRSHLHNVRRCANKPANRYTSVWWV